MKRSVLVFPSTKKKFSINVCIAVAALAKMSIFKMYIESLNFSPNIWRTSGLEISTASAANAITPPESAKDSFIP